MANYTDALMLTQQLLKLYHRYSSPVLETFSLSQAEMDILSFLHNNPRYDTAKDICEVRFMKKSIVSQSIDKLVKYGFIEKLPDEKDRRLLHLSITEDAGDCIAAISGMQERFFSDIFSSYTQEDGQMLVELLTKLGRNIARLTEE